MGPLVSLRRRTARLPTARPSAWRWRPVSVVSAMANPAPRERKSAIALSIVRALSGSSQVPKASARRGTGAAVTSEVSPKISGSSPGAGRRILPFGAGAGAHQHDGRDGGEEDDAEGERERRDLVAVERQRSLQEGEDRTG